MDIDEALQRANPIGRTQILVCTLSALITVEFAFVVLSTVFIAETPPHHCASCDTNCTANNATPVMSQDGVYLQCVEYPGNTLSNTTRGCSNGWEYDTSTHGRSIVTDWDLVCAKNSLPDLSQSIMLIGFSIGAVLSGVIADRYSRRPISIMSLAIFSVLGIAVSLSPNYTTFVIIRFFMGLAFRGIQLPSQITLLEILVPRHRTVVGSIPGLVFSVLAVVLLGWVAYWIRDWRTFHAVLMVPGILTLLVIWLQPESIRWLISQGRYEEAEKLMQRVAKFNRIKSFPSPALKVPSNSHTSSGGRRDSEAGTDVTDGGKGHVFLQLFKPPVNVVTFITSWLWVSFYLAYYGFGLTTGSLAADPYMNFFLSGTAELPGRIISVFMVRRFGNLVPLMMFEVSVGLCMIAVIVTPLKLGNGWVTTSFALLGKFFVTCAFVPINMINAELFPTTMRTYGQGFAQFIGNIGSIASPLLIYSLIPFSVDLDRRGAKNSVVYKVIQASDKFVANLSLVVMTSAAFTSALMCLFLPESRKHIQPETSEDLAELFHTKRLLSCQRRRRGSNSDDRENEEKQGNTSGVPNLGLSLEDERV